MVVEENRAVNYANKAVGAYSLFKQITSIFVFLIILVIMFLMRVPWYIVLTFFVIFSVITYLSIKRSVKVVKGEAPPRPVVVKYENGKGFSTSERY